MASRFSREWFVRHWRRLATFRGWYVFASGLAEHADAARRAPVPREAEGLAAILARVGIAGGYFVDIGASDGVTISPTLPLFRSEAWRGLAIEPDEQKLAKLAVGFAYRPGVAMASVRVTPRNAAALLAACGVPERLEVLKVDIDSYDVLVVEALLAAFRPAVIVIEINTAVPPPIFFALAFAEDYRWEGGHYFGCSITAACDVLKPLGYALAALDYDNALFVRADLAAARAIHDLTPEEAYRDGYAARPDRRERFAENADMDDLLDLPPEHVLDTLRERFAPYAGGFTLALSGPHHFEERIANSSKPSAL